MNASRFRQQHLTDGEMFGMSDAMPTPRRPRVLLAEDNSDLRAMIALALRAADYEVTEAKSGIELLELVTSYVEGNLDHLPFDVVVSDQRMPGLTGLSVLDGLRELNCQFPFILMTAFGDRQTHADAERRGAFAVLDKPFEMKRLVNIVRSCFAPR